MSTLRNCRRSTMDRRFPCLENTKILRKLERKLFKVCTVNAIAWIALTTPKKFETCFYTAFNVFCSLWEKFETATIVSHFGFVFEENSEQEITWSSWLNRFGKAPFSKWVSSKLKRKDGVESVSEKLRSFALCERGLNLTIQTTSAF